MEKKFKFVLDASRRELITPDRTLTLKQIRQWSDPRRYIYEELDTPFLSQDSTYLLRIDGEDLEILTTKEFLDLVAGSL